MFQWLRQLHTPPPSPIPDAAKEVSDQAEQLRRVVAELHRMNKTLKERHP